MAGAFGAAVATLLADPNMASPATVVRNSQRIDLRIYLRAGDQSIVVDGSNLVADNVTAEVRSLEAWTPEVGDRIELPQSHGGARYEVVREPEADELRLIWQLELRRAN